jgi:hypothetical protein
VEWLGRAKILKPCHHIREEAKSKNIVGGSGGEKKMDVNITGPIAGQIAANLIKPWYSPIINLMVAAGTLALAILTYLTLMEMSLMKAQASALLE